MKYVEWGYLGENANDAIYCCFAKTSIIKGRMGGFQIKEPLPPDALAVGFAFKSASGFTGTISWALPDYDSQVCWVSGQAGLFTNEERPTAQQRARDGEAGEPAVAATVAREIYWGNNSTQDVKWVSYNHQLGMGKLKAGGSSVVQTLPITSGWVEVGFVVSNFKGRLVLLLSGCPKSGMTACMIADDELP